MTTTTCSSCGHQSTGKRFCPGCGQGLETPTAPSPKKTPVAAVSGGSHPSAPVNAANALRNPPPAPLNDHAAPAPATPLPIPVKAAIVAAAGPLTAFAVAALTMAFAPDTSRISEGGFFESGISPLRQGAMLVLTSMGGGVVSADGETTTRVSFMTLFAISLAVTAVLRRRLQLPAWTQNPRSHGALIAGLAGGALASVVFLAVLTGGELPRELGRQSVSPGVALLVAPLMALAATLSWGSIESSRAQAWVQWIPGVCRGLLAPAAAAGIAWSVISSAWVIAGDTADQGLQPGQLLFDSLLHILTAGTLVLWAALALLGVPVQTGSFGSPFGTEITNEVSVVSTADATGIPGPLLALLAVGIALTALLSAGTIHQRVGADPHLVWRIPLLLAPTAAVFAALSSWSWSGAEYGAAWDYALIIGAAWGAVVGGLCHPALTSSITVHIPPLSWRALGRPKSLGIIAAGAAGLIVAATFATGVVQSRTSMSDDVLRGFAAAYEQGDSATVSRLTGRAVVAGVPDDVTDVTVDSGVVTIDATVDGEPVSISAQAVPRTERKLGILVESRVDPKGLPRPEFTAGSEYTKTNDLPSGLTLGGFPVADVRAVLPGTTSAALTDQRILQLSSTPPIIDGQGLVPLTFSLSPEATSAISDSLFEQASRCVQGVCRGAMDDSLSLYFTGRRAAIEPTTWEATPREVTSTYATFDVAFSWIDEYDDRERERAQVTLPLGPALEELEGVES